MRDIDNENWLKIMDTEMESTYSNFFWTLIDLSNGEYNGSIRVKEVQIGKLRLSKLD